MRSTGILTYALDILDVSGLVDAKIVENTFDRLVMRPKENKDTIKAIAKTYADSGQAELFGADFIHGKGEGQSSSYTDCLEPGRRSQLVWIAINHLEEILTFAPESVAEYTKRPLLNITAADLGPRTHRARAESALIFQRRQQLGRHCVARRGGRLSRAAFTQRSQTQQYRIE
jgi:hypothetical protein